jgi:hypothetical protein
MRRFVIYTSRIFVVSIIARRTNAVIHTADAATYERKAERLIRNDTTHHVRRPASDDNIEPRDAGFHPLREKRELM